jgi:uncharacterized protein
MYFTKYLIKHKLDDTYTLLMNTLSGAVDIVNANELSDIELISKGLLPSNSEIINKLNRRGYIYASDDEERHTFERLRHMMHKLEEEERTVITICPTYSCNFKCTYCYEGDLTRTSARSVIRPQIVFNSIIEIEKFLDKSMGLKKKPDIAFIGGEPLLPSTKDDVLEIFKTCATNGYKFRIVTNGFLLDNFLDGFRSNLQAIRYIQVTLDGPQLVHDNRRPLINSQGTFSRIAKNIQLALGVGMPIRLRTNVDSKNISSLPHLADYIRNMKWNDFPNFKAYLAPVEDSTCLGIEDIMREDVMLEAWLRMKADNSLNEDLAVFDDSKLFVITDALEANLTGSARKVLPRFKYCAAVKGKLFVLGADGFIYLCLRGIGDLRASVGKFYPNFEIYDEKINLWLSRDISNINCSSCSTVGTLQGGGCAIEALRKTGNLHACSCGDAPIVIENYLKIRKSMILKKFIQSDFKEIVKAGSEKKIIHQD